MLLIVDVSYWIIDSVTSSSIVITQLHHNSQHGSFPTYSILFINFLDHKYDSDSELFSINTFDSMLLPPPLPLDYNFPASSMPSTIKTSINHSVPSLTLSDLSFPFRLTTTLNQVGYHLAVVVLKHNPSSTSRKTSVSYERAHCVYLLLSAAYI